MQELYQDGTVHKLLGVKLAIMAVDSEGSMSGPQSIPQTKCLYPRGLQDREDDDHGQYDIGLSR